MVYTYGYMSADFIITGLKVLTVASVCTVYTISSNSVISIQFIVLYPFVAPSTKRDVIDLIVASTAFSINPIYMYFARSRLKSPKQGV